MRQFKNELLGHFSISVLNASSHPPDIFFNNTFKNDMLPIATTNQQDLEAVADEARAGKEIEVDLPNQTINDASRNKICNFEVEEFRKHCLVNGLDDIGLMMQMEEKIREFEAKPVKVPTANRGQALDEPLDW